MKSENKISRLLLLMTLATTLFISCKDDDPVDYTDDTAFPPPVLSLTSPSSLSSAVYNNTVTITGNVTSPTGIRDIYCIQLANGESGLVPVGNKSFFSLEKITGETSFEIGIKITEKQTVALALVATDVLTKISGQQISILKLEGVPPVVELNPAAINVVELNGTVQIQGHVESQAGIKSITYALVKKTPPTMVIHPAESINITPGSQSATLNFQVTVDSEFADAIEIKVTDTDNYVHTFHIEIKSISGIPDGKAYIFDNIEMAPEWEIPLASGLTPTQPYLFSTEGIQVGGVLKNVVTLKEAYDAGASASIDFAFVNVWRNSSFAAVANRGYAYVSAARLSGGPVARQLDTDWLSAAGKNAVGFKVIPQNMVESMNLPEFFATTKGNWETFQALSALADFVPTSISTNDANRIFYQRTNAGTSTSACSQQIETGMYLAFCRVKGSETKYGIMHVVQVADDTDATKPDNCKIDDTISGGASPGASAYYTGANLTGFIYDGVTKLYGRKCKLKIIVQQ